MTQKVMYQVISRGKKPMIVVGNIINTSICTSNLQELIKLTRNEEQYSLIEALRSTKKKDKNREKFDKFEEYINSELNRIVSYSEIISVETSKLEAPCIHKINDIHSDGDQYGYGLTLLIYPRVDNTIENGRLILYGFKMSEELTTSVEEINGYFGYNILDISEDTGETVLVFNNKMNNDGYIPFIMFESEVNHKVQTIDGTGIRETLFYYLDSRFISTNKMYNIMDLKYVLKTDFDIYEEFD